MKVMEIIPGRLSVIIANDGTGELKSSLREICRFCDATECNWDCEQAEYHDHNRHGECVAMQRLNAAIDGLESLVLACACANVDVEHQDFRFAVGTSLEAIVNAYGD